MLAQLAVLDFTTETARVHAQILSDLAHKGEKIGAHDLIIAATALRYGYPVLTSNTREFAWVAGSDVLTFEKEER